jgi:hypothetical protein
MLEPVNNVWEQVVKWEVGGEVKDHAAWKGDHPTLQKLLKTMVIHLIAVLSKEGGAMVLQM